MNSSDNKSNVEAEFSKIDSNGSWPLLYQHIRNECFNYDYTYLEAKKVQNKNLNRYRDVSPYDHSRVVLSKGSCDYINANLITMERTHRRYILTQGPLPHTAGHFWLMVWEQKCKAVLMLNRIIEKNQVKCHQYWPPGNKSDGEDVMVLTDVGLKVQYISETEASYYTTRILRLTDLESGDSRDILHFHYTTWPDFGVPQSPTAFLNFLMVVRQSGVLDQNVGPPVVHCSAGIGRSGTFCLVDSCLVLIEENGIDSVNVVEVLLEMRKYRMGLIQTPDQLRFSYLAIIEGAKKYIHKNNVHNDSCMVDDENSSDESYAVLSQDLCPSQEEDENENEDPPPLPPPRGESLIRYFQINDNHVGPPDVSDPPDKPLPTEPPLTPVDISPKERLINHVDESVNSSSPSSEAELRRRRREERLAGMTQQLQEMKRKQAKSERQNDFRRSLFKPFNIGIGLGVLLIGGGLAYWYCSNKV